jgi:hypothetical protein
VTNAVRLISFSHFFCIPFDSFCSFSFRLGLTSPLFFIETLPFFDPFGPSIPRLVSLNVAGLHGTRFSIRTMEARLRAELAHFSHAVATWVDGTLAGSGCDQDARSEHGNSDDEQSEVGDDSDTEDS